MTSNFPGIGWVRAIQGKGGCGFLQQLLVGLGGRLHAELVELPLIGEAQLVIIQSDGFWERVEWRKRVLKCSPRFDRVL